MNSCIARRSITGLLPVQHSPLSPGPTKTCLRNESSFRRSKQRLNVKPDDSFIYSQKSARQDHIVFNPPSSSPTVYHTPSKFIPMDDKRPDFSAIRRDA